MTKLIIKRNDPNAIKALDLASKNNLEYSLSKGGLIITNPTKDPEKNTVIVEIMKFTNYLLK